jgi:D-alanine transaminase
MSSALSTPAPEQVSQGVAAITHEDFRWNRCDIKSTSLLGNCMLRTMATEAGCAETILVRDGKLTEASSSNVFVVRAGKILVPPKSNRMLPGITYDVVLELIAAQGLAHEIGDVSEAQLRTADEIWITSSSREVMPVTRLDGRAVGDGCPGPVFRQVHAAYQAYTASVMRARPGKSPA